MRGFNWFFKPFPMAPANFPGGPRAFFIFAKKTKAFNSIFDLVKNEALPVLVTQVKTKAFNSIPKLISTEAEMAERSNAPAWSLPFSFFRKERKV